MSMLIEILYGDAINSLGSFRCYRLIDTISHDIAGIFLTLLFRDLKFRRTKISENEEKDVKVDDYQSMKGKESIQVAKLEERKDS